MSAEKVNKGITWQKSGAPGEAFAGREPIAFLGKQFQIELGFDLGRRRGDGFEISCDLLHVLVGDVAEPSS
jgi:hypothetical protein